MVAFVAHPGVTESKTCAIVALSQLMKQKSRRSPNEALCQRALSPKLNTARHRDLSPSREVLRKRIEGGP